MPFDLEKWIKGIDISKYSQNSVEYLDDYIRVEDISYKESFDLWFFQFLRIRDKDVPLLCKRESEAEELSLNDDEYVAEPMVCLYDSKKHIFNGSKEFS